MSTLDRIDYQIVRLLRNNARLSNKQLAEKVGIAPSTCLVRTRMLQQSGTLTGFKAEVNPARLGVGLQAMISVRLKRHYKPDVEAFRQHALELPEVVRLYHVAGPIDFLVHVWTKDSEHLRNLAMTAFTSREEVSHIETELIFEHVSCQDLPTFIDAIGKVNFMTVLDLDLQSVDIWEELQQGYYYGEDHVVRVSMTIETVWLRSWVAPLMPDPVKETLGVPLTPQGDAGG